jgi:hypothetical protein
MIEFNRILVQNLLPGDVISLLSNDELRHKHLIISKESLSNDPTRFKVTMHMSDTLDITDFCLPESYSFYLVYRPPPTPHSATEKKESD